MGSLDGRTALVTGAGSGIGAGIARVLAREGAELVLTDLDLASVQALADELGGRALRHDVTDRLSCAEVAQAAGHVDVLVNNAGVSSGVAFLELTEEELDRVIAVNLKGAFLTTQAVVGPMIERRSGSIVSISSMAGKEGLPLLSHYCATKFGVLGMTQSLAKELAPHDVRVNAVCPGVVRTPLWEPLLDDLAASRQITREAAWQEFVDPIPLGRPQEPSDIGEAVAFLASDRARNMTGQGINVTGGMQLH